MIIFKRLFIGIISLIVLLGGCAQSVDDPIPPDTDIPIDWVDFVKIDGIQYLRTDYYIEADDLGSQISEVKFKLSDNISDSDYIIKDGDAAYLEKGTPIYNIKGYQSSFLIAVQSTNERIVYQVFDNPSANIGSDIVDIFDKVDYIEITSDSDDVVLAEITDFNKIKEMVEMVLNAPVNLSVDEEAGIQYFITFYLKEGFEFKGAYCPESGQFSNVYTRFVLPVEFKTVLDEALKSNN